MIAGRLVNMNIQANPFVLERATQKIRLPSKVRDISETLSPLNLVSKSILYNLRLKKRLTRALANNCIVNRYRINFEVNDGSVRLFGFVDTLGDKRIIEDLVNLTGGFRKVYNEINVRSSVFKNQAEVVGSILYDLSSYLGLDLSKITVEVKNGTAYLRGFVSTVHMKYAAEELVHSTPQITRTVNELKVMY
jgi:osmotically-inducible protein OsmY